MEVQKFKWLKKKKSLKLELSLVEASDREIGSQAMQWVLIIRIYKIVMKEWIVQ